MPIDQEFEKKLKPVARSEHGYLIWGPGKDGAAAESDEVKSAYEAAGEKLTENLMMCIQNFLTVEMLN